MKLFIIRLLLIALLYLLFAFVIHWEAAIVWAFVGEYVFEPLISQYL